MAQLVRRGELGFESAQSLLQHRETPTAVVALGQDSLPPDRGFQGIVPPPGFLVSN
jgi:hypothetical protein